MESPVAQARRQNDHLVGIQDNLILSLAELCNCHQNQNCMKSVPIFFAACFVLLNASCRGPRGGGEVATEAGVLPNAVRPADLEAVAAFQKSGGSNGFFTADDKLTTPITAANTGFIVDLDAQRAYLYQGSKLIAYSPISSGRKFYRTETGSYTIGQKDLNHRSTSYGNFVNSKGSTVMGDVQQGFDPTPVGARFEGSLMKWFMRFHYKGSSTAIGFHRGVLPGYPASHGCVRLPGKMAEWFFSKIPVGTRVLVQGKSNGVPKGASQNRPKRSPKVHRSLKKPTPKPKAPPSTGEDEPVAPKEATLDPMPAPEPTPAPAPTPTPEPPPVPESKPSAADSVPMPQ
jgi:lipoprotein-anchoring transpeptidase ErfK/SrfK